MLDTCGVCPPERGGLSLVPLIPLTKRLAGQGFGPLPTLFAVSCDELSCFAPSPASCFVSARRHVLWPRPPRARSHAASLLARARAVRRSDRRARTCCSTPGRASNQRGAPRTTSSGQRLVSAWHAPGQRAAPCRARPAGLRATSDRPELWLLSANWARGCSNPGERGEPGRARAERVCDPACLPRPAGRAFKRAAARTVTPGPCVAVTSACA